MKVRLALATSVLALSALFLSLQTGLVKAQGLTNSAVTSPVTMPLTVSFSGHINYQYVFRLFSYMTPAKGVNVSLDNTQNNHIYSTQSDSQGNYIVSLPAGQYTVDFSDTKGTVFSPNDFSININENTIAPTATGYIYPLGR